MEAREIDNLIKELCDKRITHTWYDKTKGEVDLIHSSGKTILEEILRKFFNDNRDEKLGILEAKIFVYEEIISKSNFSPMLIKKEFKERTIIKDNIENL